MNRLTLILTLVLLPLLGALSGCANDCDTFCARQGRYIDRCLPQFDSVWTDLNADWDNKGDFVATCKVQVSDQIDIDISETCANAADAEAERVCETTVREGIYDSCSDDLNRFQQSCTDYPNVCDRMCTAQSDLFERCLPTWETTWEEYGYTDKDDYLDRCLAVWGDGFEQTERNSTERDDLSQECLSELQAAEADPDCETLLSQ